MTRVVLAIDPGRVKCGLALVSREDSGRLQLLWRNIVPPEEVPNAISTAKRVASFSMVVVGQGTTSRSLVAKIREYDPGLGILLVDERDTTLQARERYWEANPRKGWRKLLPSSMQVPPDPIDDYAAYVLAERVLI